MDDRQYPDMAFTCIQRDSIPKKISGCPRASAMTHVSHYTYRFWQEVRQHHQMASGANQQAVTTPSLEHNFFLFLWTDIDVMLVAE